MYPPLQVAIPPDAVEASSPVPSRDILEQLVPVDPPEVNSSMLINGIPTIQANMLQVDFHKDDFDRRPLDPQSGVVGDPSDELIFELMNGVLSILRSVTQASGVKPLTSDDTHWRLDYLTDEFEELPHDGVNIRRRFGATFRWQVCAVTQEVWDKVQTTDPERRPPNWEILILDAESLLPDVGPSLVLAATTLETLISITLDHLAAESDLPTELWQWINERGGDYRKEPSVGEQFDILLKVLANKSLKEESRLWEGFQNLRNARNSFVHEGKATIGRQEVTKDQAYDLVGRAKEIVSWLEPLLPSDWHRPILNTNIELELTKMIVAPPALSPEV